MASIRSSNQTLVFIDASVHNYQTLAAGVKDDSEVAILDPNREGIEQITQALATRHNLDSIHIVSHGSEGNLYLGSGVLNAESLEKFSSQLQQWRKALTEKADILLYGCCVATGKVGQAFVQALSELVEANVAASTNLTGNSSLGGDWNLGFTTGLIQTSLAFNFSTLASYNSVLGEVHFNVSSVFDIDGIVNRTGGVTDPTQNRIDLEGNALITQSFASFSQAGGVGLPDNGFFAANALRPNIDLQYDNADNDNNLHLINTSTGSFNFPVTAGIYSDIHVAALSTEGSSDMRLVFTYSDNTTAATSVATVPDWYSNITESTSLYYLIDNMDRASISGTFQDANAPALFGLRFVNPNSSKTVTSITVEKTTSTGYLAFLGATGINNIAPTVSLTSSAATTVNAPFVATATFSESTTNFVASDISVTNGTVTGFSGSGTTYSFTVNPTNQGAVTVNVPNGVATDAAGNNNLAATALTRTFDSTAPTVTIFTPTDDGTDVAVGANLVLELSEDVKKGIGSIVIKKVSDNTVVETLDVTSANVTVSGRSVTVNPTSDLVEGTQYYVEIANGAIQDLAGNNYTGITGATAWNFTTFITPDTTAPTATNFTPANNAANVAVGANLVLELSEDVNRGIGNIVIRKSDNSIVETFNVNWTNVTVSGRSVTLNPTADLAEGTQYYVEIANGAIQDLAGNNYTGIRDRNGWNFTTAIANPLTISSVTSSLTNGSYGVGTLVPIAVNFSEVASVTGTPQLLLNSGGLATYASGSGTNSLIFNYTVAAGENTADLDATWIIEQHGTIRATAGYNADPSLPLPGTASSLSGAKDIAIDTFIPRVRNVTSSLANGRYRVGQVIPIAVNFSEAVNVSGTPTLSLQNGGFATYSSGSGSNSLIFNYTVAAGQDTEDLSYRFAIEQTLLAGGMIRDTAGNNASRSLPVPGTASSLIGAKDIAIDTSAPRVHNVTSSLANGNYTVGQVIPIAVNFSEAVNVSGTPTLSLHNGGFATYSSGSGSNSLIFNYTVAAGQSTPDLDYASATALALNGGTIRDTAGNDANDATLSLPTPGAVYSLGWAKNIIVIEPNALSVSTVTSSLANGNYTVGQVIPIAVNFSEAVNVTGTPTLSLNNRRRATYASGSGTNSLIFNYTVAAGEYTADLDYASATALALMGGRISDTAGNIVNLTLPIPGTTSSLGGVKDIVIDTSAPTVRNITSSLANGNYTVGQVIPIAVNFSETVNITGTPTLSLNSKGLATYASGSGTNRLIFNYTVATGQSTADLDYASTTALALNNGTIRDTVGNDATLSLSPPGRSSSLGGAKDIIVIDPNAPSVSSPPKRAIDGYISNGKVFFDANLNGVLDNDEPFTTTLADGSFALNVDVEKFDTNQNGELDYTEGKFILIGGVDTATGLAMATPLTSTLNSAVVTPLTTIIADLVQQGTGPAAAEASVKAALGLPTGIGLGSYDPLEAIAKGDTNGVSVFGSMIQVQNTIVQMAKFIDGVSETAVAQLAYSGISAIANQFTGGTPVDLSKAETIQAILQDAITKAAQSDPQINPTQLAASAAAAAQIVALGNQMVEELVASGRPIKDIATDITKLQAVSVGQVAVGLPELAAGTVSVEEFLAKNTKEAIFARMETVEVNDPTVRPTIGNSGETPGESPTPTPRPIPSLFPTPSPTPTPEPNARFTSGNDEATLADSGERVEALAGDDTVTGGISDDWVHGNQGNDHIFGNDGNDTIFGGKDNDIVDGGAGDDSLLGNRAQDTLTGGMGNDFLWGGKGFDSLIGGDGDDTLSGDLGGDTLIGGSERDLFVLRTGTAAVDLVAADLIADFQVSIDQIGLTGGIGANNLTLSLVDGNTIITLAGSNQILGVVNNFTPDQLSNSFVSVDVGLV